MLKSGPFLKTGLSQTQNQTRGGHSSSGLRINSLTDLPVIVK
jgi:hypothetical protein